MADYGAQVSIPAQNRPTIFEVVAQESLLETLQSAFKHILQVLAEKNPSRFGYLLANVDEVFLCLHSVFQLHYLTNYSASFSENFYDLKRVPLHRKADTKKRLLLPPNLIVKSALALTVVPYIQYSLDKYFRSVEEERLRGNAAKKNISERLKNIFVVVWPKFQTIVKLTTLFYYIRYLTGEKKVHSPLLHICGVTLTHLTEEDTEYITNKRANHLRYSNVRSLKQAVLWLLELAGWSLRNSTEIGAFFIQFLEWFYSSNSSSRKLFASGPIPPPPHKEEITGSKSELDKNKCPICMKERKGDTVLSVSGYVFCYSCILLHVRKSGTCPVTNYPASTKQLIRIYERPSASE